MKSALCFVLALSLAAIGTAARASGSLVFSPAASPAQVGDVVVVEVRGLGFTDNVVGGGFDLSFDPAVLGLGSVQIDVAEWELVSNPGTIDNQAGTLSAVWFNAFAAPLPTGSFPVATLRFNALAPGLSGLQLRANAIFPFVNDNADLIAVDFGQGAITVSAVPEPSAATGLLLGLALWPWLRRRLATA